MLALYNIIQMSNKLIIMSKVRSIIRLYTEGVSKQSIGERTGLPRNSVKKYIRLFLASGKSLEVIEHMSDTELEQMFMDIEHKAGEKMYVDYGGEKLKVLEPVLLDTIEVEVFVAILGASQLTYVEASYTQQKAVSYTHLTLPT